MRLAVIIFFFALLGLAGGCSSQPATNNSASAPSPTDSTVAVTTANANANAAAAPASVTKAPTPSVDACTLLTSDEIKAVQGEALKNTVPSNRVTGEFIVTQCYYELPTASNSISVTMTENNPEKTGGQTVKDFWESTFGKDEKKSESEREKEKKKATSKREGEEEERVPMESVRGVGDEAFWSANRVGGALYVLKGQRYIRISVGGKGDVEAKLKRSKMLAQKALRRL